MISEASLNIESFLKCLLECSENNLILNRTFVPGTQNERDSQSFNEINLVNNDIKVHKIKKTITGNILCLL